jgi:hypothetical protein
MGRCTGPLNWIQIRGVFLQGIEREQETPRKHPGLQKDTRSWLIEAWAWNPAAAQKQNHPIFNGIVNDV